MDQDDNGRTYDNEKNGSIFLNERKTEDWHSDFRGNIVVEGVEYYINGYKNVSKDGLTPYIKIQLMERRCTLSNQIQLYMLFHKIVT